MRTPLLLAAAVASVAIAAGPAQAKSRHTTTRFAITIPNSAVLTNPPNLFASPTEPPPGAYTISGVGAANGPGKLDGKLLFTLVSASPTEEVTTAILSLKKGL